MQACHEFQDQLTDYLYGDLPEQERIALESHLAHCSLCAREVRAVRQTLQLLEAEPELPIPTDVAARFEQGVYRKIALETLPPVRTTPGFLGRMRSLIGFSLHPSWNWVPQAGLMAASLALGIWIGAFQLRQEPALTPTPNLAQIPSAQERLTRHWEQEMEAELDEARTQRYLRGDVHAALAQYARVSELQVNDDLTTQAEVARDELSERFGI